MSALSPCMLTTTANIVVGKARPCPTWPSLGSLSVVYAKAKEGGGGMRRLRCTKRYGLRP